MNVTSIKGFDTLSMLMSVFFDGYVLIANTSKVESSKMKQMSLSNFRINVLIFIFIFPPFNKKRGDTQLNVPNNIT